MPRPLLVVVVIALGLLTVVGCKKKLAEGTCRIDIDCRAGFDCKAGRCVERPRPPWEQPAPTEATTDNAQSAGAKQPAAQAAPAATGATQQGAARPGAPAGDAPGYPKPGQKWKPGPRVFPPDT